MRLVKSALRGHSRPINHYPLLYRDLRGYVHLSDATKFVRRFVQLSLQRYDICHSRHTTKHLLPNNKQNRPVLTHAHRATKLTVP